MAKKSRALGNDPFRRGAAPRVETTRPSAGSGEGTPAEAAASAPLPDASAEPKRGEKTKAKGKAEPTRAENAKTRSKAGPERGVKASAKTKAAPKRRPVRKTRATAAPAPRRARAAQERELEIAGDAGLLPDDLAAGRPPPVVAVAPVPPRKEPSTTHSTVAGDFAEPPRARDAFSAAFTLFRQLVGLPARAPSFDVDELGYDPRLDEQTRPFFDWFYDRWFRVQTRGFEKLPARGPVMLVANRAGTIPWDSAMLMLAARRHGLLLRPLLEDDVFHFPGLGVLVNRLGTVRACPENAEAILSRGGAVAVFPEGATGFTKPFRERYRLQRFGRGGFAKLALRTGATIYPVAIVGSEEIHPLLARLPRLPGIRRMPITPTFPWLGAAGLMPLPSKWQIELGEPFDLSTWGAEAEKDDPLVLRITEQVRGTIQAMLDARLSQRRSIFR